MTIEIVKPTEQQLQMVSQWPVWQHHPAQFDWDYTQREMFYIVEGRAQLSGPMGEFSLQAGDLVTVPACGQLQWQISEAVKKHYKFFG